MTESSPSPNPPASPSASPAIPRASGTPVGAGQNQSQILIVDDARDIREPLGRFLRREGYRVRLAASADEARAILAEAVIHLVVLDIMMPGEDGLSLCAAISGDKGPPVILLTARVEESAVITGLDLGADDYVTKPFNPQLLLARIRSVMRRNPRVHPGPRMGRRAFAGLVLDPGRRRLILADQTEVDLTAGENRLLSVLLDHAGSVLSRATLSDLVWGREAKPFDRSVDNTVSRLRRKIGDDPREAQLLVTEWGGGYRLCAEVEDLA